MTFLKYAILPARLAEELRENHGELITADA
jgi:hypothetical protein